MLLYFEWQRVDFFYPFLFPLEKLSCCQTSVPSLLSPVLRNKLTIALNLEVTIASVYTTSPPAPLPTVNDICYYNWKQKINEAKECLRT